MPLRPRCAAVLKQLDGGGMCSSRLGESGSCMPSSWQAPSKEDPHLGSLAALHKKEERNRQVSVAVRVESQVRQTTARGRTKTTL